jgi:hypothetical protein
MQNKDNYIIDVINLLKTDEFYGAGKYTEIAKGSREIPTRWSQVCDKVKRLIKSKR